MRRALNLAESVARLELAGCAHRDIPPGNILCDDEGRVHFIDLDSLFHSSLPFQQNTIVGTMGYIAPFTRNGGSGFDARASWCPLADRFALAVLIAEFILVDAGTPAHEDGTLFGQAHLGFPDHPYVREQARRLFEIVPRAGVLFEQALRASSFDGCPSPDEWRSLLRNALKTVGGSSPTSGSGASSGARVKQPCAQCGQGFWIGHEKLAELQHQGKQALCPVCLQTLVFSGIEAAWARRAAIRLAPFTDPLMNAVGRAMAQRGGAPLPNWVPWIVILLVGIVLRQTIVWAILCMR